MKHALQIFAAGIALGWATLAAQPIPKSYRDLKFPPLGEIKAPEPVRFELANGMVVYLVEDRELPLIGATALVRTGARWEPPGKAGLASITGTVMRTGGSTSRSGDQLDEELDRLAAVVETSIGLEFGRATMLVLKEDVDRGLEILADLLRNPAFPQDKIELAKIAQRDAIARRNDDPSGVAFREFARILYSKDSPYGRQPEYETIDSITRDDLVRFHREFFQPENVIMGVWGDFRSSDMRARIERIFGAWPRGGRPKPAPPTVESRVAGEIYLINKEDVNQSWVLVGGLAGRRDDPDYFALTVANSVLSWRLLNNVRTAAGLAYATGSVWEAGWDRPGIFRAFGNTKLETTARILEAIRAEIAKLRQIEVEPSEFTRARDSILKGFAFEFDSTQEIVERMVSYEYYGYPRDYLQRFRAGIEKVTPADVLRAARSRLDLEKLTVLVLGREKGFERPLSAFGKVVAWDITIPQPKPAELAAATPETTARGKRILAAVREALGGAKLDQVKDYVLRASVTMSTPQGEFSLSSESTVNVEGKLLEKVTTPMGEIVQGFDGQTAWMKTPQGVRDAPSQMKTELEAALFRNTVLLLRNLERPDYTVQWAGTEEFQGKKLEVVAVSDASRKLQVKLYVDPETNLLVKKTYVGGLMGAPGELEEVYSDWREAEGLKLPFVTTLYQGGQKRGEQKVTEVRINAGVEAAAYTKP
ncbi:MAG: insulinase family protein [Bryobacterales bacterium]|nr:insulinase family protein [Bryobacteraceae bacterium]MDW8354676.1 insulinase family protein [Bryobacterales bacterium]